MSLENCNDHAQGLIDLMSCFAQKQGQLTAQYVNGKIQEVVDIHGVDLTALHAQIEAIMGELASNEIVDGEQTTALNGILNAISNLQTAVANNQTSITNVNSTLTTAINSLETSIANEQARVNAELARIEALIPTVHQPYNDTEVRELIAANLAAIGSESATRISEIARLEAIIATNSADIENLKAGVAANVSALAALQGVVDALSATVTSAIAAVNARIDGVEACLNGFFNTLSSASCDDIAAAFSTGLAAGGAGDSGAL